MKPYRVICTKRDIVLKRSNLWERLKGNPKYKKVEEITTIINELYSETEPKFDEETLKNLGFETVDLKQVGVVCKIIK
jgi:hypothetical protein